MNPLTQAQLINLFLEVLYYQRRYSEASTDLDAFLKRNNIGDAQLQAMVLDAPKAPGPPEKGKANEMDSPDPAPAGEL